MNAITYEPWGQNFRTFGDEGEGSAQDRRMHVRFFTMAELQSFRSEAEGHPIYENRDMVEIRQPGERDAVVRRVQRWDTVRFKPQWEAYQNQREQVQDGVPLMVLFPHEPAIVEMMKGVRLYTIEALAGASEEALRKLGIGARQWNARAKQYLAALDKGKGVAQLQHQAAELERDNADLRKKMEAMAAQIEAMQQRSAVA